MALIICPECGRTISSAAKQCVNCGYPVGTITKNQLVDSILQDAVIEQLQLSIRTYKILRQAGIKTVRDIVCLDISQLMQIKNMRRKSLEEIFSRLYDLGLQIHEDYTSEAYICPKSPATKFDWKCERAPSNIEISSFKYAYNSKELDALRRGFIPSSMDNKWFCYYENAMVNFYRSWTGKLICSVILNNETNEHIIIKYYNNENEREHLGDIDAPELIRCVIDGKWNR